MRPSRFCRRSSSDCPGPDQVRGVDNAYLELRNLSKSYGKREALKDVSLRIARGEIVGLLGPNGAGKSTAISLLTGLLTPTAGEILWEGRPLGQRTAEWRRGLGVVLEDLALFEYLSIREHLRFIGRLSGLDARETEGRARELLRFFQLEDASETIAAEASQGTRKKLAFALGLIHSPRVLLLDEALNGIDAVTVSRIKALLKRMAAAGVTIILSSHVLDSAETVIQRCLIVDKGRVALDCPMQSIRDQGRSLEEVYTATLLGRGEAPELSWVT
jgi:ABC-2 type transport system ATP-binding protein